MIQRYAGDGFFGDKVGAAISNVGDPGATVPYDRRHQSGRHAGQLSIVLRSVP